ncbi:MAG: maleylacetoacetate isomerase [Betaproteobacteria bacterium]
MKLYGFWRSSAAYRVRIAMGLKGLSYDQVSVNLTAGEQHRPAFGEINPQHLVPVLDEQDDRLYQSLAIIEYLEETHPEPPLLPKSPVERNRVRSLALIVACEIHPLNNPRVLNYLTKNFGISDDQKQTWYSDWVSSGFAALEKRLAHELGTGRFCHGDTPSFADVALVPQVANANRFKVDLTAFPTIRRINEECLKLVAFQRAAPEQQPDAA